MSELRRGDDPPTQTGRYVIEIEGDGEPQVFNVDVAGGCVWVEQRPRTWNRWNRMPIVRYRKWDALSYLEGATP